MFYAIKSPHKIITISYIILVYEIAISYNFTMKMVRYTIDAARDMKRHGNMAARIRKAINEYAAGSGAHANNVTKLVGVSASRLRVGDFQVIFEDGETEIIVTKIAPRGGAYD